MRAYKLRIFNKNGTEIPQQTNIGDVNDSNLYMGKVSTGLVETENLLILGEDENGNLYPISEVISDFILDKSRLDNTTERLGKVRPKGGGGKSIRNFMLDDSKLDSPTDLLALIDEVYVKLLLYIDTTEQTNLRFFTVNEKTNEVVWTNKIMIGANEDQYDMGIHIGFIGDKEGIYETNIYICEVETYATRLEDIKDTDKITCVNKIVVHNQTVGEDTRYRHLFKNFGIPDPITYLDVFKDSDIFLDTSTSEDEKEIYYRNHPNYHKYDDKVDFNFLNEKSKELFLSYSDIFPYVGTYKALINAVDYLGYDDVYFKEWFKELEDTSTLQSKNVSYEIAYKSGGHSMLTKLPLDRRISLKKLNWLSMIYKISEFAKNQNGEQLYEDLPDNVRIPLIQNNYAAYEADEILIKLISLKQWLEKNIIGLNCRIIEINGEGIVVERYKHRIYGKTTIGSLYNKELTLTPFLENTNPELEISNSMCKLRLGVKEQNTMSKDEFLKTYKKIMFKAYLSTKDGAFCHRTLDGNTYGYTDVPVIIQDGEIFFDSKTSFRNNYDASTGNVGGSEAVFLKLPTIQLEKARLRNLNDPWKKSIEYAIDDEGTSAAPYRFIRNAKSLKDDNNILYSKDYVTLRPMYDSSTGECISSLKYTTDNQFGIPMFILKNFTDDMLIKGADKSEFVGKSYILEILDGKFVFNDDSISIGDASTDNYSDHVTKTTYINFHFDNDNLEQNIEINYVYSKIADLEDYKNSDRSYLDTMTVQNIGDYTILAFACDEYNSIYCNQLPQKVTVYMRDPSVYLYSGNSYSNNKEDFYNKNEYGEEINYYSDPLKEIKYTPDSSLYNIYAKVDGVETLLHEDSMFSLFLDNNKCKMKESYMLNDVSVIDSSNGYRMIKYVTYPTMSYAIDTPKEGDIAHFMNICDNFKYFAHVSSDSSTSELWREATPLNSNLKIMSDYVIIWLKQNKSFEGNTLNTGVMTTTEELQGIKDISFVIYDKIHNEVVYQASAKLNFEYGNETWRKKDASHGDVGHEEDLNYIIIDNNVMLDIYMYYKNIDSSTLLENWGRFAYRIDETVDVSLGNTALMTITQNRDYVYTGVLDFMEKQRVFEYFCIPTYEIPIDYIIHYKDGSSNIVNNIATLVINDAYKPEKKEILKVGDKIKVKYKKVLNSDNTIVTQSTYTVIAVDGKFITINGYYSFNRFEKSDDGIVGDYIETCYDRKEKKINPTSYTGIGAKNITAENIIELQNGTESYRSKTHYSIDIIEKTISSVNQLLMAHSNGAYVDYEMDVEYAIEKITGDTDLFVKDDGYLYYVDNTYSIITKPYSTHVALSSWMPEHEKEIYLYNPLTKEYDVSVNVVCADSEYGKIYKYKMPVTLNINDANIFITPSTTYDNFQTFSSDMNERHSYFRVYKYDKYNDKNVLQFESWNDGLFLNLKDTGIYTVELFLYDNYGNLISKTIEGLFKVVE